MYGQSWAVLGKEYILTCNKTLTAHSFDAGKYMRGAKPWKVVDKVNIALPCATQNEVDASDAAALIGAGMAVLCEGANMPCEAQAIELMHDHNVEFGPAKACNAGEVLNLFLAPGEGVQARWWETVSPISKVYRFLKLLVHICVRHRRSNNTSVPTFL